MSVPMGVPDIQERGTMTDGRHFTDIYRERQDRARLAADDRFRREAFNYWALHPARFAPPSRIIGEDYDLGGSYYRRQPQWYQTYWDRRRRAEEDAWGGYGARRFDDPGRLYGDRWGRPYAGPGSLGWSARDYTLARAEAHRQRLASETFARHVHPLRGGRVLERVQMRDGTVHEFERENPALREPATPLGNQGIQIADDPRVPNYRRIEGNLHDVRFVDGYTLDSRMLAGRLTTSVFHGGAEQFRVKKNPGGTVSEVSWNQEGQRYSLAYDVNTGGWQTFRGDRNEMRPIRGAGLDGWNIDNLDSRGRLHCSNGRPGEHMLIGRNLKQMVKLNQVEYDEYKRTGNVPDRWEDLDLITPRRPRPVLA